MTLSDSMLRKNLRRKLGGLLLETQAVKTQLRRLRQAHLQEFTFAAVLGKSRLLHNHQHHGNDRQNANINANRRVLKRIDPLCMQDKENMRNMSNIKGQMKANKVEARSNPKKNTEALGLSKNRQELLDIKNTLWVQLAEIKNMEKKQQAMRKANEKMKEYSSQQKRQYRESLSKDKSRQSLSRGSIILDSSDSSRIKETQSLFKSEIEVDIPITLDHRYIQKSRNDAQVSLKCCRGHSYYEGQVNDQNQPHGNGRLEVCCEEIATRMRTRDAQFYQGQFEDGLFHGYGTISYRGGVKYVGEFRQGKRQGKGSLYHNGRAEIARWNQDKFVCIM